MTTHMGRPRPIRVARVIARLNVGGPARHVVWLAEALSDSEFETELLTGVVPPGEQDMTDFAAARGVEPVVIREMSREISPRDVVTTWKLYRHFATWRPDVVHTHTAKAGAAGRAAGFLYRWLTPSALVGRPRRVRFVHTYHGHVFHSYYGALKTRLFLAIERTLARIATDAIVVLSEQQRREIHEQFRVGRAEQFRVIPLGLDFDEITAPSPRQASRPLVTGIVGRLTAIKNHAMFLRVAQRLRARDDLRFAIYGDGGDRPALESLAASMHLGENVRFEGVRNARDIYGAIDIAALTSLNEGTPLTLIEAMCNAIPAISTAAGGVVDLLGQVEERVESDGASYEIRERGITSAIGDDAGFAAGLARLADDAPLRARLAERGRAYARATFSRERLVEDIRNLYRQLLSR